jgi:hypothetical protein
LLQEHPTLRIIAVAPYQNYGVCYWASLDIHSDDIEPSEAGFLRAVRGVAEGVGVDFEPKTPVNARILN